MEEDKVGPQQQQQQEEGQQQFEEQGDENIEEIKFDGLIVEGEGEDYECLEEYYLDCCRYADMEELKECLENEIDITWFNKYLNNALHMASANGHIKVLEIIIQEVENRKFDQAKKMNFVNHKNSDGNTPLHWAVINNKKEVVEFLINKCQADTGIKNVLQRNPFEEALELQRTEILEILAKSTKPDLESYQEMEGEDFQVPVTKEDAIEEQDDDEAQTQEKDTQNKEESIDKE